MSAENRKSLAVIGAGPKAAALAAKAEALRICGLADIEILIFDKGEVAAHWKGRAGYTSGHCTLGTPPEKDVGFPYHSQFGATVDREMLQYSWAAYLVSLGAYSSWVDRGRRHPRHEKWGGYLEWVIGQTRASLHTFTTVSCVSATPGNDKLLVRTNGQRGEKSYEVDGVVLTGPGKIRRIVGNHLEGDDDIDGKRYWGLIPVFRDIPSGKVAIIGGGETAASVAISILENNPKLTVEIINPVGALFSRGESFFENQLFSSGEGWTERSVETRKEIIRRTDQGVFSVDAMNHLAESQSVRFRGGRVTSIDRTQSGIEVRFAGEEREELYEKVVIATGFDNWQTLEILDSELRPKEEDHHEELILKIDSCLRLPIANSDINVHVPMLSGISQGPGFPNLSCLGLLADRILAAYM